MTEGEIQRNIKKHLEKKEWFVTKLIQTSTNGITDLMALKKTRKCVFIEVKRPGQKPNPLQDYRHEQLRRLGFEVIVATCIDDVEHL